MPRELDQSLARQWLGQVSRAAGLGAIAPEFIDRVFARLAKGARDYGDETYLHVELDELLREAAEEGDDIAGWLVLVGIRLMMSQELDPEVAQRVQWRLMEAAARGVSAWKLIQEAREMIETPRPRLHSAAG
jgi:hypothetical protein